MKAKEALVRKSAFPKPPTNFGEPLVLSSGMAHLRVTEEAVSETLMTQAAMKASGPDKINFRILQMVWGWDKSQMTQMVYHAIRLGSHPTEWKKARGIRCFFRWVYLCLVPFPVDCYSFRWVCLYLKFFSGGFLFFTVGFLFLPVSLYFFRWVCLCVLSPVNLFEGNLSGLQIRHYGLKSKGKYTPASSNSKIIRLMLATILAPLL